ncbi:TldD/PmbA family protein [Silvimonas iriomotensis]|uniref:Zn-dependent protease n=1 Tax=Silvimonas iriomotensis TaxID=449662 RepID=A0ABQ2P7Q8_9NEIS|nr:metallopeptidase TldD-related protein [Silvimonas iriomotensis]GGP20188.1 Zn-dependent protease [Silvimonas iriomotensis]
MSQHQTSLRTHFYALADLAKYQLQADEGFTLWLEGETSDFIRFNHGLVRQAGQVAQAYLTVRLVNGQKHISQKIVLSGNATDEATLAGVMTDLREALADVEEDPHLLLSAQVQSTEAVTANQLPPAEEMVADITEAAAGLDLVGILAVGPVVYGFANHHGQRNWQETASWNFDWSLYSHGDKAVKRGSAGFVWDKHAIRAEIEAARAQAALLGQAPKSLTPGAYRAYLTPAALGEIISMLNWGGFSEKSMRTKRSPLLKLQGGASFSDLVSMREDTVGGLAPRFQQEGFIKPDHVALIDHGKLTGSLISPRTAREYNIAGNGADGSEAAASFSMLGGELPQSQVLEALGTGLYVSNLWYLNYSDRAAGRLTGMTRFACFWVENGEIVAPLNVMRFDDTLFRMLGSELEALTQETTFLADAGSYGGRSSASMNLPGALLRELKLVL